MFELFHTSFGGLLKAGSLESKKEQLIGMKIGTILKMKVCQTVGFLSVSMLVFY